MPLSTQVPCAQGLRVHGLSPPPRTLLVVGVLLDEVVVVTNGLGVSTLALLCRHNTRERGELGEIECYTWSSYISSR